jgi:hypothetical protein
VGASPIVKKYSTVPLELPTKPIKIDKTAPTVTANPPAKTDATASFNVNLNASDLPPRIGVDISGLDNTKSVWKVYKEYGTSFIENSNGNFSTNPATVTIPAITGTYHICHYVLDNAGNRAIINGTKKTINGNETYCFGPYTVGTLQCPVINSLEAKRGETETIVSDAWFKGSQNSLNFSWRTDTDPTTNPKYYYKLSTTNTNSFIENEENTNNSNTTVTISEGTSYFFVKPKNVGEQACSVQGPFVVKYDNTAPTCVTWSPSGYGYDIPWKTNSQTFVISGIDATSGLDNSPKDCTVSTHNANCSVTLRDNAGNTKTCSSSPNAKIMDPTNLLFFADYTDNPNGFNSDIASSGRTVTADSKNANQTAPTGLTLTPGAGNFVSYDALNNINTTQGKIEMVVNGADLKQAGYSYLFDMGNDAGSYNNRMVIYKDTSYLQARLYLNQTTYLRSRISNSLLSSLPDTTVITVEWTNSKITLSLSNGTTGDFNAYGSYTPISLGSHFFIGSQVGGAQGKGYVCPPYNDPNATCNVQYQYPIKSVKILSQ